MALGSPKTRSPRSIPAAAELLLGATGHRSLLPRGGTSSPQPLALPCAQGRHHPPEGCSQPWLPALRPFGKQGGEGGASFAWEKGARQRDPGAPTPCQKCLVLISSSAVAALRGALLLVPWLGAALPPASLHLSLSEVVMGVPAVPMGFAQPQLYGKSQAREQRFCALHPLVLHGSGGTGKQHAPFFVCPFSSRHRSLTAY